MFFFATALYRPYYTNYCNLRLALIVGLSNMALVLPVTCGLVTNPELSDLLAVPYLLLVASLWVFCSKLGADILGFERESSDKQPQA
jgi:tryptophan-rich sensory protein